MVELSAMSFSFEVIKEIPEQLGRAGVISTPHGQIATPAFIPVGTKATLKSVLPETLKELGAQAVLANAYHLYLQPGYFYRLKVVVIIVMILLNYLEWYSCL